MKFLKKSYIQRKMRTSLLSHDTLVVACSLWFSYFMATRVHTRLTDYGTYTYAPLIMNYSRQRKAIHIHKKSYFNREFITFLSRIYCIVLKFMAKLY